MWQGHNQSVHRRGAESSPRYAEANEASDNRQPRATTETQRSQRTRRIPPISGEAARNGAFAPWALRPPLCLSVAFVRTSVRPYAPPGSLSAPPSTFLDNPAEKPWSILETQSIISNGFMPFPRDFFRGKTQFSKVGVQKVTDCPINMIGLQTPVLPHEVRKLVFAQAKTRLTACGTRCPPAPQEGRSLRGPGRRPFPSRHDSSRPRCRGETIPLPGRTGGAFR